MATDVAGFALDEDDRLLLLDDLGQYCYVNCLKSDGFNFLVE